MCKEHDSPVLEFCMEKLFTNPSHNHVKAKLCAEHVWGDSLRQACTIAGMCQNASSCFQSRTPSSLVSWSPDSR